MVLCACREVVQEWTKVGVSCSSVQHFHYCLSNHVHSYQDHEGVVEIGKRDRWDEGDGEGQERGQQSEAEGEPEQSEEHISQKEAEQLLEALKNREIDAQKRRYRATSASRGKDW